MKIKPYYVLLKWRINHPENKNRSSLYDIWQEYDEEFIYDSILYDVIDSFDTHKEAVEHKRRLLNG